MGAAGARSAACALPRSTLSRVAQSLALSAPRRGAISMAPVAVCVLGATAPARPAPAAASAGHAGGGQARPSLGQSSQGRRTPPAPRSPGGAISRRATRGNSFPQKEKNQKKKGWLPYSQPAPFNSRVLFQIVLSIPASCSVGYKLQTLNYLIIDVLFITILWLSCGLVPK